MGFEKTEKEHPDLKEKLELFKKSIILFEDDFFDCINYSILCGEYVVVDNFDKKLNILKNKIENLRPSFMAPDEDVAWATVDEFGKNCLGPIGLGIAYYKEFYFSIKRKLQITDKDYLYQYHSEIANVLDKNEFDRNSSINLKILQANIFVARADHFLSNNSSFNALFSLNRDLKGKLNVRPYSMLIRSKCGFLLAKLMLRKQQENDSKTIYVIQDNKDKPLSVDGFVEPFFQDIIKYVESHYQIDKNWKQNITGDFEHLKDLDTSSPSTKLLELHRLIKYYKDVGPNIQLLSGIRKEIEKRFAKAKKEQDKYNVYALSICLNYAINNEFSAVCEKSNSLFEDVETFYVEVLKIQTETHIKNFFPQYKFLEYIVKQLKNTIKDRKALEAITSTRRLFDVANGIVDKYEDHVKWTVSNYKYVYQLPLDESFVEIDNPDAAIDKMYLFSSFLLPLPENKNVEEFETLHSEVKAMETSIAVLENINEEIEKTKAVTKDIKEREARMMEILGIFTAVVTFAAASVQGFTIIKTPLQAFFFMLAFSTSLSSFVIMILVLFRGVEKVKKNLMSILSFVVVALVFWIGLLYLYGEPNFQELKGTRNNDNPKSTNSDTNTIMIDKDSAHILQKTN